MTQGCARRCGSGQNVYSFRATLRVTAGGHPDAGCVTLPEPAGRQPTTAYRCQLLRHGRAIAAHRHNITLAVWRPDSIA